MSYVFYDTETTGNKTAYDQILQFAAIRTDSELNELGRTSGYRYGDRQLDMAGAST